MVLIQSNPDPFILAGSFSKPRRKNTNFWMMDSQASLNGESFSTPRPLSALLCAGGKLNILGLQ